MGALRRALLLSRRPPPFLLAQRKSMAEPVVVERDGEISYSPYTGEHELQGIINLISVDLSEPYSIFTYRYFINNWPNLTFIATTPPPEGAPPGPHVVGTIVCKQDQHRSGSERGYIAMLAVHHSMRKRGMGSKLVQLAVRAMHDGGCDEAVLETEVTNLAALRLYEGLGFVRDKRLHRYYLNGNDAYRLKVRAVAVRRRAHARCGQKGEGRGGVRCAGRLAELGGVAGLAWCCMQKLGVCSTCAH